MNLFVIYASVTSILFGMTCKSNTAWHASYYSTTLQYFYTLQCQKK